VPRLQSAGEPAWIGIHARSREWLSRAIALLTGAFDGVWLGLLERRQLDQLDHAFYARRAREDVDGHSCAYTDERHTRSGLHQWERAAILGSFPAHGRVVITGAGAGREVLALLELGYDAVGYEPNPTLVDAGASLLEGLGYGGRLRRSERDAFPADAGACDAIMVGWGAYMHVRGAALRIEHLARARECLREGGPLLVSFLLRPPERRYFRVSARVANLVRRLRRSDPIEVGDCIRTTAFHLFTREEIELELESAGFRLERFEVDPYGHAVARAA
jgi:hypothetical protein